jgi:hypothetical protein
VQNPPQGIEGDLYRELRRTQPVPQGICVMNSSGKVLSWSLTFEDDASVLQFLDHNSNRYTKTPTGAVAAERFRRFPMHKMDDVPDNGTVHEIANAHRHGEHCPGKLRTTEGALLGRVVGRALGAGGQPLSNERTQDNYVEDRFEITTDLSESIPNTSETFPLPQPLARALVSNVYLGQLDVGPLGGATTQAKTTREEIHLHARPVKGEDATLLVWGTSDIAGTQINDDAEGQRDGRLWKHSVNLNWQGYIHLNQDGHIKSIHMIGTGTEKLRFGNDQAFNDKSPDVAKLLGGRPIDFDGPVRYGITVE